MKTTFSDFKFSNKHINHVFYKDLFHFFDFRANGKTISFIITLN